jgi:hypothetical protein
MVCPFFLSCSDDHATSEISEDQLQPSLVKMEQSETDQSLNPEVWKQIEELKKSAGPGLKDTSDGIVDQYRVLLNRYYGLADDEQSLEFERRLSNQKDLTNSISLDQVQAWRELSNASHGRLSATWDQKLKTPSFIGFGIELNGNDGKEAKADFDARFGTLLQQLFQTKNNDTFVLDEEQAFDTDDGAGGSVKTHVQRYRYHREFAGLPVFSDIYDLTLRTSDWNKDKWVAFLYTRWLRDLDKNALTPALNATEAETIAALSREVTDAVPVRSSRLGILTINFQQQLAYEVWMGNQNGQVWLYYVSAITGEIVQKSNQVAKYDGTLQIYVGRPHEGVNKYPRSLPNATIYEDYINGSNYSSHDCWNFESSQIRTGDPNKILGETSYSGIYQGITGIDPSDTNWTVDYAGPFVQDLSPDIAIRDLDEFQAGGTTTFPQQTDYVRSRRGEVFYLVNYGHKFYQDGGYGTPTFEPTNFTYITVPALPSFCQNPVHKFDCCSGNALSSCFIIRCGVDMELAAAPSVERRFRSVVFHEQNHTLRTRAAGDFCYTCSGNKTTDGPECSLWEEGRAMYGAASTGKFEHTRPEYVPDKKYPDDFSCEGITDYYGSSIWTAVYLHCLLHTGVGSATKDIHFNLADVDPDTRMVGLCSDTTGDTHDNDGYVEVHECPSNSTYRHLLSANESTWSAMYQRQNEISEVFHYHVTDAFRNGEGVIDTFPWADETPNHWDTPAFVPVEFGSPFWVTSGVDPYSGLLRLETSTDYDTWMFLGRAGKSYTIQTDNLTSGMDTYLEVLDGYGNVLASNDDCNSTPRSCLTFTPTTTKYYRVRVTSDVGSQTGPGKTYGLGIAMNTDDYGNTRETAGALIANGVWRTANFYSFNDTDYFKIPSSGSQTLQYLGCSTYGAVFDVLVGVYNSSGQLLSSNIASSCSAPMAQVNIGTGVYFLKVTAPSGTMGYYKIKAQTTLDIDSNSTAANAWLLTNDSITGRILGSAFETTTDEDWYKFNVSTEGRRVIFETYGLYANVNTLVEVYTPSTTVYGRTGTLDSMEDTSGGNGLGHWMLQSDDAGYWPNGSRLAFLTPVAGTYYVRVKNTAQTVGGYYVMFEDTGLNAGWVNYP